MKKVIITSILITIIGCAPKLKFIPKSSSEFIIDFSKYSQKGFLFTPYQFQGEYESIGLISISIYPEAKYIEKPIYDQIGMYKNSEKFWHIKKIKLNDAIDEIYQKAKSMGANAIIDFDIIPIKESHLNTHLHPLTIHGIELTGFAIKRLDKIK